MITLPPKEVLRAKPDRVMQDTVAYFEGPGRVTNARLHALLAR